MLVGAGDIANSRVASALTSADHSDLSAVRGLRLEEPARVASIENRIHFHNMEI